mmetsp:Transcript_186/g.365  ORF Transcript_186/g.365 Transcript_186/m.365 type:complete len:209 (-) Transcript_186:539-1165(-)
MPFVNFMESLPPATIASTGSGTTSLEAARTIAHWPTARCRSIATFAEPAPFRLWAAKWPVVVVALPSTAMRRWETLPGLGHHRRSSGAAATRAKVVKAAVHPLWIQALECSGNTSRSVAPGPGSQYTSRGLEELEGRCRPSCPMIAALAWPTGSWAGPTRRKAGAAPINTSIAPLVELLVELLVEPGASNVVVAVVPMKLLEGTKSHC